MKCLHHCELLTDFFLLLPLALHFKSLNISFILNITVITFLVFHLTPTKCSIIFFEKRSFSLFRKLKSGSPFLLLLTTKKFAGQQIEFR